jgi:catechol 2,3-dioxygenase-like lactoylglutathione lyase family enzyme
LRIRRGETNLYVRDLDRAARFYCDALDFELVESEESYRKLRQGGFTLTLFKAKSDEKAEPPGTRPSMSTDLLVDDLDEAVARVEACGGTVAPVRDWEEGRFTLFRDPDGISWELISHWGSES